MAEPKQGDVLINPKTGDAYQVNEVLYEPVETTFYTDGDQPYATVPNYELKRIEIKQL